MRFSPWLVVAGLIPVASAVGDGPPARYEVVAPRLDAISATGINGRGDVVGFEWAEDPQHPGVIGQEPFFARGVQLTRLPLLPTYTSTFPAAVSDTGLVVGRSSKPGMTRGRRVPLQNQGFVWTEGGGISGLGALPGDHASLATGVARDGSAICGVSIGDQCVRPCVWDRDPNGAAPAWRGTPLPQVESIASTHIAMSDDGRLVAGLDGGTPTLWTRPLRAGEPWTRESLGPLHAIHPRAVNNAGTVAGIIAPRDGSTHAVVWTRALGVEPIPEPAGYTRSEASALNSAGSVVGMIDGPAGSPVAPRAFVFENGRLRVLEEGGASFVAATAINDRGQVTGVFEQEEDAEPVPPARPGAPKP